MSYRLCERKISTYWLALLPRAMVVSGPRLLLKVMSGSVVIYRLESTMMALACGHHGRLGSGSPPVAVFESGGHVAAETMSASATCPSSERSGPSRSGPGTDQLRHTPTSTPPAACLSL